MTVTEKEKGTMTEEKGQTKVTPEAKVKTPEPEKVSSEEEKIYTQEQADALVHAAKSDHGRILKEVETQRDGLKSQILTKENELEDNRTDIETLEKKIEDLASDDLAKFDAVKELKIAKQERRDLKAKLLNLDNREQGLAEREKKVNSFEREVLTESIADEYEDGDSARLKKAVSVFENPKEEQIRNIADVIFTKKAEGEKESSLTPKVYSGNTSGGGDQIGSMSPKERVKEADRRLRTQ